EFTDAWEQRKLGNVVDIIGGGTPDTSIPEYWEGDIDWYSPTEIGEQIYAKGSIKKITELGLQKSSAKILPAKRTILFTSRASIGDMAILAKSGTTNQGFQSFVLKGDSVDLYFLFSLGHQIKRFALKHSTGSTFLEISKTELGKMNLYLPKIQEQQKIGSFFTALDRLITTHQRKLENVKKLKKSLLQKMFPKNGQEFPEIRFPEFTDAWEQRKLGNVVDIIGGGTPDTSIPEYWEGDIDWYSPTEIGEQIYAKGSIKKITELGLQKSSAKILPAKRTILFTSRASIGDMAILAKSGTTNQGFQSFVLKGDSVDLYFLFSLGHQIKRFALKHSTGSTFLEISKTELGKMNLYLPKIQEQQKIGSFFTALDRLITTHQRKLENVKKLKKALLQQMFV
ncbi:restriction endonuclease subunit S, partial [Pasteurella multocida]